MISYEEIINAGYQIKANAEQVILVLKNNRNSVSERLNSGGLSSTVATGTIMSSIDEVSRQADDVYTSVLELCEFITKMVPEGFKSDEESIRGKFADLTMQMNDSYTTGAGVYGSGNGY